MATARKKRKSRKGHETRQPSLRRRHERSGRGEDVEESVCYLLRMVLEGPPTASEKLRLGEILDRMESEQAERYDADERRAVASPLREAIDAILEEFPPPDPFNLPTWRAKITEMRRLLRKHKVGLGPFHAELSQRVSDVESDLLRPKPSTSGNNEPPIL